MLAPHLFKQCEFMCGMRQAWSPDSCIAHHSPHTTIPPAHTGYRIYSVTSDIKTCSLGNSNPFRTCAASTANRMLAVETDATCVVRVYVLGDSA